jgi:hypothetical protein
VILRLRSFDQALGHAHRLLWKTLQPQDPRQRAHWVVIELKSDNRGPCEGTRHMVSDGAFQVTARVALIALDKVRVPII